MIKRTIALLLASGVITTGVAFSQTSPAPNPTQQTVDDTRGTVPLFKVTVVGRTTPAINYRPRHDDTKIDFAGTPLLPQASGKATVSGEKGHIKIDASFRNLQSPEKFGREYLTYVLWAITPEGRASNLGELQVQKTTAEAEVTTDLQAFGLLVTAEPYFAVTQPSDVVVMENVIRDDTKGSFEVVQAKYELLKRGSYLMNQDAARLNIKPLEPGAPLDLAQARNAVELARLAGADRFAADTFTKAAGQLANAEEARTAKRGKNAIMMAARQAAQTAEDARLVGLQRQEEAFVADQKTAVLNRESRALELAQAETDRRRQAENAAQAANAGRAAAERDAQTATAQRVAAETEAQRLAAQRAAANAASQTAAAGQLAAARAEATDADAARAAAESARAEAEAARSTADAARLAAEAKAEAAVTQAQQDRIALRERLRTQLNLILQTRETARGLIVNLSDVLFDSGSNTLKPGAREKLSRVSGILVAQQGLRVEVEGHTDSVGTDDYNQKLSERRGESVRAYLVGQGISSTTVGSIGLGETKPVTTNDTASGRQQNRRVELVVSGAVIGTN